MNGDLRSEIVNQLISLGWTVEKPPYDDFARKSYPTAVGPKEAIAYLRDHRDTSDCILLTAEYQSEGRNVLSTIYVSINNGAGDAISSKVALFSSEVDETVSKTYAAKLLRVQS